MILKFDARRKRADAPGAVKGRSGKCEIILFPGVRYERWSDDAPPVPPKKKSRRKSQSRRRA